MQQYLPFTVLKLEYGIARIDTYWGVATVLTVYGIETGVASSRILLAYLPLQQYLPFTVLKQEVYDNNGTTFVASCNSTYRLRY